MCEKFQVNGKKAKNQLRDFFKPHKEDVIL